MKDIKKRLMNRSFIDPVQRAIVAMRHVINTLSCIVKRRSATGDNIKKAARARVETSMLL
jgi:hypothetical protein